MIIDIRGTHGSGKSFVPSQLIKKYGSSPIMRQGDMVTPTKQIGTVIPELKLCIVGVYNRFGGGGCDAISPVKEICARVREFSSKFENVLLEGILVAHTFQRWADMSEELKHHDYRFYQLDTPLDLCMGNVRSRRAAKGDDPDFNTKNLRKDFVQIARTCDRLRNEGRNVSSLDHNYSVQTIENLLCSKTS